MTEEDDTVTFEYKKCHKHVTNAPKVIGLA